jgi:tetratricopeptide (TPR) repeat protein
MSNLAKLKKKAADLEQKRQLDKALPLYQQIVDGQGDGDDADVALCNRVGDLLHRAGRVNEAISYWERAVEMYSARGFLDNAIAICRKILRASPASVGVHHKLGVMHAKKGLRNDAKLHFLEYADRMQRLGEMDEAFKALKEFADLCPEHEDVRQSLAEQLIRHDRIPEALEQLDLLHARYRQTGSIPEAEATLERIRSLDPDYEPHAVLPPPDDHGDFMVLEGRAGRGASPSDSDGLILIGPEATAAPVTQTVQGIELTGEFEPPASAQPPHSALDVIEDEDDDPAALGVTRADEVSLDGFQPTAMHSEHSESRSDLISPAATLDQLDTPDPDFELPPMKTSGIADSPDGDDLLDGDFILSHDEADDSASMDEDDVRSHRSEDGDAAAELAAEAQRRGHQRDVMDELGVGDVDSDAHAALADLPLLDSAIPVEPGAADVSEFELESPHAEELPPMETAEPTASVGLSGPDLSLSLGDAEELLELPPLEVDADLVEPEESYAATQLWDASPVVGQSRENAPSWRRTSDMMRDEGDIEGALRELESVLEGFVSTGDLLTAGEVLDEMISIEPRIGYHRERVDLAFRGDDRVRLRLAYEGLANALSAAGETVEAASVRQRIAELDAASRPGTTAPAPSSVHEPVATERGTTTASADSSSRDALAEFVNLGDLLRADEPERTTRMVVEEQAPSGDEQADFAEMLAKFRKGLEENVDADDFESHHDLGVAFREMGLLDEAIVEFQKALRGSRQRLRSFEALGECFVEKEQFQLAAATLRRAMQETNEEDDQLVGVWYLLGVSLEALGQREEAVTLYERVLAVDYGFRDAAERASGTARAVT